MDWERDESRLRADQAKDWWREGGAGHGHGGSLEQVATRSGCDSVVFIVKRKFR
jgi:hypothetical protein